MYDEKVMAGPIRFYRMKTSEHINKTRANGPVAHLRDFLIVVFVMGIRRNGRSLLSVDHIPS